MARLKFVGLNAEHAKLKPTSVGVPARGLNQPGAMFKVDENGYVNVPDHCINFLVEHGFRDTAVDLDAAAQDALRQNAADKKKKGGEADDGAKAPATDDAKN